MIIDLLQPRVLVSVDIMGWMYKMCLSKLLKIT